MDFQIAFHVACDLNPNMLVDVSRSIHLNRTAVKVVFEGTVGA